MHIHVFPLHCSLLRRQKGGGRIKGLAGRGGDFASPLSPKKRGPPPQSFLKGIFLQVPPFSLFSAFFALCRRGRGPAARRRRTPHAALWRRPCARVMEREPEGDKWSRKAVSLFPPSSFCARKIGGENGQLRGRESFPSTKRNPPPASAKVSGAGERRIGGRRGRTNSCVRGK